VINNVLRVIEKNPPLAPPRRGIKKELPMTFPRRGI
jgi:hypothetical protein